MKFAAIVAAIVATVAATNAANVTSVECPASETDKLNQIKSERTYNQCVIDGKYSFVAPTGEPTDQQARSMCTSMSCFYYTLPALVRLRLSDCDLKFSTGATVNMHRVVDDLARRCGVYIYNPTLSPAAN
jgi:hypothetical protein